VVEVALASEVSVDCHAISLAYVGSAAAAIALVVAYRQTD
jgi:hypothetical protein